MTITIEVTETNTYVDAATSSTTVVEATPSLNSTFLSLEDTPADYTGQAGKTFVVNTGETGIEYSSIGSGDVSGPGSSTDNAIVRFDGTGGKTLQNSIVTIDDTTGVIKGCTEVWFDSSGDYKIVLNGTALEIWVKGTMAQRWG